MTSPPQWPGTAAAWSAHAQDYTRLYAPITGHIARTMVALVAARLPAAPRILDIACGPGDLAVAAALHCAAEGAGSVLATDVSPVMVAATRRALATVNIESCCEVRDGQALALDGSDFDAAFSCFGIFLFPDRPAGWRAAAGALRPGGLLVTSAWRGPDHNELARVQMQPLIAALPGRITQPLLASDWERITTAAGLANEVTTTAPFDETETHIIDAMLAIPGARAMWQGMLGNPVTGKLIAQCNEVELQNVKRAVLRGFESRTGGPDRPLIVNASCNVLIARRVEK